MGEKRVIITGATGMVGGCALRICLENPDVSQVTVIGRSPTGINDARLREVIVDDITDYSTFEDTLENQDVALFCLGAYTGAVPDDLFRQITVDYTLAFARYKGAAENGLLEIGFPRGHIFRPGYIYPVTPRKEPNLMYTVTRFLYPLVRRLYPNIGISSEDLAAAMVHTGQYGTAENQNSILENKDIRSMKGR